MTIYDIRRKNLRNLMDDLFDGKQVELANALERSPSYVSRILSLQHAPSSSQSNRNIGEALARTIEKSLKLPPYSLDYSSDQEAVVIEEPRRGYQVSLYSNVDEAHRRSVDNVANALLQLDADQAQMIERALRMLLRARPRE